MLFRRCLSSLLVLSVLLLSALSSYSQDKYGYLLDKKYAERIPLFDSTVFMKIQNSDQEAFRKEIEALKQLALNCNDEGLYMESKLCEWYYNRKHNLFNNRELISQLEDLLVEAQQKKLQFYALLMRFEIAGQYFYRIHDYQKAFREYIENVSDVIETSSSDFPNKKSILLHTANAYYNFGDYINTKKYLLIADTIGNSWRPRVKIQCKNTLGLIHRKNRQFDSAMYSFKQCIDIAKESNEHIWVAIASGNIGISYYQQNLYSKAIPLLKLDVDSCFEYKAFDNGVNSLIMLVNSYIKIGKLEKANHQLKRGWSYADSMRDKTKHLPGLYDATSKLSIAFGKYKMAHTYRDSAKYYEEIIKKRDDIIQLARVESRIKQNIHENEVEKLKIEKKLISTVRNWLLLSIILLSIITYLIINRQRIKHIAKHKRLLLEKELAETKLENASNELAVFTKSLKEKNQLIQKTTEEIGRLHKSLEEQDSRENNNAIIQQLYDLTILTDEEWDKFRRLFEQVYTGYIHRLKEKYSDLSPADIRFVVLSKLKLSNKEMAGILGVRADSMRTYKHRIRKKFNIPDDDNLQNIIDNI